MADIRRCVHQAGQRKKKKKKKKKSKQKIDKIHFTLRMFVSSSGRDLTVVRFYSPDKLFKLARILQLQCDVILVDSLFVWGFFFIYHANLLLFLQTR